MSSRREKLKGRYTIQVYQGPSFHYNLRKIFEKAVLKKPL